jgi:chemotaxis-related protein WspD
VTPLPVTATPPAGPVDCWNRIGVRGDRSCPTLAEVGHCQNCPVYSAAGRRFLDAPSPPGYLEEWTDRLAVPTEDAATDLEGVLVFRLADEWLALSVHVLVEVALPRPVRRVPHRPAVLAGLVNIRGELYLCAYLNRVLGITPSAAGPSLTPASPPATARLLVVRREGERWVLPVDEVDQVRRVPRGAITRPPATVGRAAAHLTRGVFPLDRRSVGLLDEERVFEVLRAKLR